MELPKCPIHRVELEHTPQGWHCPVGGFYWRVRRGKVSSRPMWGLPKVEGEEEYDESIHEAFMSYLQTHGWTKESYEKLTEEGKQLLFERWKATAGLGVE